MAGYQFSKNKNGYKGEWQKNRNSEIYSEFVALG